ncbi:unnamed protein product [Pedinophyceae sp. YPF-701]|nr:unnamed protein product [Pedinophyceae sp. YPF-701]
MRTARSVLVSTRIEFEIALAPLHTMDQAIRETVSPPGLVQPPDLWSNFGPRFRGMVDLGLPADAAVTSVIPAPDGVLADAWPRDGFVENGIGLDLFAHPNPLTREAMQRGKDTREIIVQGPYMLVQGFQALIPRIPVFPKLHGGVPRNAAGQTSVFGERFHDPEPDGTYFWGMLTAILRWDRFLETSGFNDDLSAKYEWQIAEDRADGDTGETALVVHASSAGNEEAIGTYVERAISVYGLNWRLRASRRAGWEPTWIPAGYVVSSFLGALVGLLAVALLCARHEAMCLLNSMLPPRVVGMMRRGERVAERFPSVALAFIDIVGYTSMSNGRDPSDVLDMLDRVFTMMDKCAAVHGVFRLDVVGDQYIAISGAYPGADPQECTERIAAFAQSVIEELRTMKNLKGEPVQVRVGVHFGGVTTGIVGSTKWTALGDAMNTGSRMESTGKPGAIHATEAFKHWVTCSGRWTARSRTTCSGDAAGIMIKGKGVMRTYWITPRELNGKAVSHRILDLRGMVGSEDPTGSMTSGGPRTEKSAGHRGVHFAEGPKDFGVRRATKKFSDLFSGPDARSNSRTAVASRRGSHLAPNPPLRHSNHAAGSHEV